MDKLLKEIDAILTESFKTSVELKNKAEQREHALIDQTKEMFLGLIDILDSHFRIESSIREKSPDDESAIKTAARFKIIEKKLINLLGKFGISRLEFPDNKLIVGYCEVIHTEVHPEKNNDDIVSVVRNGYVRGTELIRAAQIVIVRN
jgi:molecular chaperone GrpE (heat shock protein)